MEKSCKTCINSDLDGAPDIINQACIDCCRLSNYEPEESKFLDQFNWMGIVWFDPNQL